MIVSAAFAALAQIFTPPLRRVFWKTLGLTLLLLVLVFVGAETALAHFLTFPARWLATSLTLLAALVLFVGFVFAITPVSFLVAGFFFDELAGIVEEEIDPQHPGRTAPLSQQIQVTIVFALLALALNIVALALLLVPGVNAAIFLLVNAYLLGRGYFELAALRHRPPADIARLRRGHELQIFLAGMFIAALAAVPIVNLLTPLFGAALMVRVHDKITIGAAKA